jgi:hypothetical protein
MHRHERCRSCRRQCGTGRGRMHGLGRGENLVDNEKRPPKGRPPCFAPDNSRSVRRSRRRAACAHDGRLRTRGRQSRQHHCPGRRLRHGAARRVEYQRLTDGGIERLQERKRRAGRKGFNTRRADIARNLICKDRAEAVVGEARAVFYGPDRNLIGGASSRRRGSVHGGGVICGGIGGGKTCRSGAGTGWSPRQAV